MALTWSYKTIIQNNVRTRESGLAHQNEIDFTQQRWNWKVSQITTLAIFSSVSWQNSLFQIVLYKVKIGKATVCLPLNTSINTKYYTLLEEENTQLYATVNEVRALALQSRMHCFSNLLSLFKLNQNCALCPSYFEASTLKGNLKSLLQEGHFSSFLLYSGEDSAKISTYVADIPSSGNHL